MPYEQAPAGLPLVQHALLSLFDQVARGHMTMEQVVQKTAHNPAIRYGIEQRGFIREGYFADLVLVDTKTPTLVTNDNSLYHCGWSPFASTISSPHKSRKLGSTVGWCMPTNKSMSRQHMLCDWSLIARTHVFQKLRLFESSVYFRKLTFIRFLRALFVEV